MTKAPKTLRRLKRFWNAIEQLTDFAATPAEWKWLTADEHAVIAPLLRANGRLATSYPRFGTWGYGSPCELVGDSEGRFVGIDPDGGPSIELTRADLMIQRLDVDRFCRMLCDAFGFAAEPSSASGEVARKFAVHRPTSSTSCLVYLVIWPDEQARNDAVRRLLLQHVEPIVALTAGSVGDQELLQIMRTRRTCHLVLEETVGIDSDGALRAIRPADLILRQFKAAVEAYEDGEKRRYAREFKRVGAMWQLTYEGPTQHIPHTKASGLAYIHQLLQRPYTEVGVIELEELVSGDVRVRAAGDAGEMADDEGRRAMRDRYRDVGGTWSDDEDGSEAAAIRSHLDAVEGLGGRPRRSADQVERSRVRITNLITNAIQKIDNPKLAVHLDNSIRRGRSIRYAPESPVDWVL